MRSVVDLSVPRGFACRFELDEFFVRGVPPRVRAMRNIITQVLCEKGLAGVKFSCGESFGAHLLHVAVNRLARRTSSPTYKRRTASKLCFTVIIYD